MPKWLLWHTVGTAETVGGTSEKGASLAMGLKSVPAILLVQTLGPLGWAAPPTWRIGSGVETTTCSTLLHPLPGQFPVPKELSRSSCGSR